jgi:P-type conjugative transfer protein TrbJ
MKPASLALAILLGTSALAAPARAQWAVFDAANFSQNLLQAARALQQINNQIQSLQNQAQMLTNMGKNLSSLNSSQLGTMISALTQIGNLMNQGNGIAFNVGATNSAFAKSFPQNYLNSTTDSTLLSDAHKRWQDAMAAFLQAMQVQAQITQNVQSDSATLTNLVDASQGADGNLQVTQAGNQLLALSTKQQLQIENLMAAQYRANALEQARNAEAEEEGRAAFQRFMGTGNAYTPQ